MKHTPGPWSLNKYEDVVDRDGRAIRVCGFVLTSTDEAKANARLIAAAPELLQALEWALKQNGLPAHVIGEFRDVIAKATGEE